MNATINLLGIGVLIMVFLILLIIDNYREKRTSFKRLSKKERRLYPRYEISLRIKYKVPLEEGISWIRDISKNGARLYLNNTLKTLKIGESLGIEIYLPYETQPIFVQGSIVWSKENDAGFQFDKIAEGDINRISQYINDRE